MPGARVVASPPDDPEFQHLLVAAEYNHDNGAQLGRLAYDISEGTYDPSPAQILHVFRVCLKRGAFEQASAFLQIPRCAEALGREKPRVAAAIANRTAGLG